MLKPLKGLCSGALCRKNRRLQFFTIDTSAGNTHNAGAGLAYPSAAGSAASGPLASP